MRRVLCAFSLLSLAAAAASCKREPPPLPLTARAPAADEFKWGKFDVPDVDTRAAHLAFYDRGNNAPPLAIVIGTNGARTIVDVPVDGLADPRWEAVLPATNGRVVGIVLGIRGGDWDWDTLLAVSSEDGGRSWKRGPEIVLRERMGDPHLAFDGDLLTVEVDVLPPDPFPWAERLGLRTLSSREGRYAFASTDLGMRWRRAPLVEASRTPMPRPSPVSSGSDTWGDP